VRVLSSLRLGTAICTLRADPLSYRQQITESIGHVSCGSVSNSILSSAGARSQPSGSAYRRVRSQPGRTLRYDRRVYLGCYVANLTDVLAAFTRTKEQPWPLRSRKSSM